MNRNENLGQELAMAKNTILAMKRELADKMAAQITFITNGTLKENDIPMRMECFSSKMNALNKILSAFDKEDKCLSILYEYCQDDIEKLYNDIRNGGNLCFVEGLAMLSNLVEKYGKEVEGELYSIESLTPCMTYYHAILDGNYIDRVLSNLKDCRAELIEQVEMLEEDILAVDASMEEHGVQGYLNSCNLLINALENRKPDDLLEHESALECFYAAMKNMFQNNEDIVEACKFAVKIFMKENRVTNTITNQLSFYVRDLESKEDVVEYLEETASKIKESILDDWYVEDKEDLQDKKDELESLFFVFDYLKALLI